MRVAWLWIVIASAAPAISEAERTPRARVARDTALVRAVDLRPRPARTRPQLRVDTALARRMLTFGVARRDPAPVPWFWEALRSRVYRAMPQVQQRGFTMTLAPVVVTGTEDTVPGLGIAGDF